MDATTNKQLMKTVFLRLADGDAKPLIALMADEFCWTVIGNTRWSGSYRGKDNVLSKLLGPLAKNFAVQYRNRASRFIAENDMVVVESRGDTMTKRGDPYQNTYCYVCRLENGRLVDLMEYCDTELVTKVL